MSLLKYSDYQESGVSWIGDVPKSWSISPLKYLADFVNGCVFKPDSWSESGVPIVRIENLNGSLNFNFFDGSVDERHHVGEGDLLFGWSGNRGTSFGPFLWKRPGHFFLNQHIFKIRPLHGDSKWLYWCLKAVTAHVEDQATGIIGMVHVTKGDLGAIKAPVPYFHEQVAIANFLDRETAKIDALIAEQEKLIALLAEKRQATISRAVTRGLDPNVPLKDSGVPWLGKVPAHWELKALKRAVVLQRGHDLPSDERAEGAVPVVSSGGISGYHNVATSGPTIVTGRYGTIGEFILIETDCWPLNTALYAVEMYENFARYIWYMLRSLRHVFILNSLKSAVPGVDRNDIHPTKVCLPALDEQRSIAFFLDSELAKFDLLRAESERSIELLKERRAALISAAVTGKIDVRGLAA